jgi:hypothetical protein
MIILADQIGYRAAVKVRGKSQNVEQMPSKWYESE